MPTSSKRLRARAEAYAHAAESLALDWTDDAMEFYEGVRVADWLEKEYYRLTKLAERQEEKEKKS